MSKKVTPPRTNPQNQNAKTPGSKPPKRSPLSGIALWGVALVGAGVWAFGTFYLNGAPAPSVASVGGTALPTETLKRDVQSTLDSLREQAAASGAQLHGKPADIAASILDRMVSGEIVELERQRLGIVVDDKTVDKTITADGRFKGASEAFDHAIYAKALADSHLSESRYKELLSGELARTRLVDALASAVPVSQNMADALYRLRDEKRVPDTVFFPLDSVKSLPEPTEQQLGDFYASHKDQFFSEYRSFTLGMIGVEDLARNVALPDERLKEEYQARLSEMKQPEQRELLQLIAPDEATAKKAAALIGQGKDFIGVARDVAHEDEAAVKLGWTSREDFGELPQIAAAAFDNLKEGEVSPPLKGAKGWHIVKVTGIRPQHVFTFEEAKAGLAKKLAEGTAAEELVSVSRKIKVALAGGATLDAVAKEFGMKPRRVDGVNADGRDAKGQKVEIAPQAADVLREAFLAGRGETTRLVPAGNDAWFLLRIEDITPPVLKPLAEVKDKVKSMWLDAARRAELLARANEIAGAVTADKTLAVVAQTRHIPLVQFSASELFRRSADDSPDIPQALVAKLFELKFGQAAAVPVNTGIYVVSLAKRIPAAASDPAALGEASESLRLGLGKALMTGYTNALRERYPVVIHQDMIDKLF